MTGIIFKGLTSLGALAGTAGAPVAAAAQQKQVVDIEPIATYMYKDIAKIDVEYIREAVKAEFGANNGTPLKFINEFNNNKMGEYIVKISPDSSQRKLKFTFNQEFFKAHHQWKQAQSILKNAGYYASINQLNVYQLGTLVRWTQQNRVDFFNLHEIMFHLNIKHHTEYITPPKRAWARYVESKPGEQYDFTKLTKWLDGTTVINKKNILNYDLLIYLLKWSFVKVDFKYGVLGSNKVWTFASQNVIEGAAVKIFPPLKEYIKYIEINKIQINWNESANKSNILPLNQFNPLNDDKVKYDFENKRFYFR